VVSLTIFAPFLR